MNITRENIDALNAVVKVDIVADDYQATVTEKLADYRKNADIPGFRKGSVPMGMIKKRYGKSIIADEVNKLLTKSLFDFLDKEKLDFLGNPLPRVQEDFDWDGENFSFEFELGLSPKFDINLNPKKKVVQYNIIATEELIDKEVKNIQTRYGKISSLDEATQNSNITGTFINEEKEINKKTTFLVSDIKAKKNQKKLVGVKVGDVVELPTKKLFEDDHKLQDILGVSYDEINDLDIMVTLTIEDITKTTLADLDKELFDKLFSDESVSTVTELRKKIKEDAEKQFQQQSDQQLSNAIIEHLIEKTKFDLPSEFLQKWLATAGEKELSADEALEEYNKSEKGLRYQLIEEKIMKDNDIKIDYSELMDYTKELVRLQMTKFSNIAPEEEELTDIAARILKNEEESKKTQSQLINKKLLDFYKENMTFKTKEVSFEDFIKEAYK